ncbi:hypothetical protein ACFLU8_05505 [Chloroflexota bacterium]
MIDWSLVGKIAGGGYGLCILVLVILSLVAWIVGLIVQKTTKPATEDKEDSGKG